jgi:ribosome-associated translation inhibitor RaiA
MKVTVEHAWIPSTDHIDSLVEDRILALSQRIVIDEARVRLECSRDVSPKYRVSVHLVTPGPDLLADERDHTLPAAIQKVMERLEARLDHRDNKRRRREVGERSRPGTARGLHAEPRTGPARARSRSAGRI